MPFKPQYTPEEKAQALALLAANAGNIKRTARELRINPITLRAWIKQANPPPDPPPDPQPTGYRAYRQGLGNGSGPPSPVLILDKTRQLADVFEDIAYAALGIAASKLEHASASQAAVIAAISVDKMRLLREQATALSGSAVTMTDEERLSRIRELEQRVAARKALAQRNATPVTPDVPADAETAGVTGVTPDPSEGGGEPGGGEGRGGAGENFSGVGVPSAEVPLAGGVPTDAPGPPENFLAESGSPQEVTAQDTIPGEVTVTPGTVEVTDA